MYKADFPILEKLQITFITDPQEIEKMYDEVLKIYEARDLRVLGLKDEEVDRFYGCVLCQSFAPTHVCIITPERPANCGAITWIDAKVAAEIDPKGPIFPIEKGELLDPVKGEWSGVNKVAYEKSQGTVSRVCLYSAMENPHTVCGCFEAAVFYIPEVDGFGIIHRGFTGRAPNGLRFADIADAISGGKQIPGFLGIGVAYLRSRKFLQADGGWKRIVWMPSELKERIKAWIPPDMVDKIATEKDVKDINELREFLIKVGHPLAEKIKEMMAKEAAPPAPPAAAPAPPTPAPTPPTAAPAPQVAPPIQVPTPPTVTVEVAPGLTITLKNVKIEAERLIIKKKREEKKK